MLPLRPAPLVKQDGADNNAGERHAAKRFMTKWRQDHPPLQCIVTADSLRSHAPPLETLQAHQLHSMVGVNEGEHASLCEQVQAAEQAGRVTSQERPERAAGLVPRFRLIHAVPLHESNADVRVNFIEYGERGPNSNSRRATKLSNHRDIPVAFS